MSRRLQRSTTAIGTSCNAIVFVHEPHFYVNILENLSYFHHEIWRNELVNDVDYEHFRIIRQVKVADKLDDKWLNADIILKRVFYICFQQ